MNSKSNFFDDLSKIAGSAAEGVFGSVADMKSNFTAMADSKVKEILQKHDLVTREEFEVLKQMLEKAIIENDELKERIAILEKNKTEQV